MRAILLLAVVGVSLPLILYRPHLGVLLWVWLSFMNPHRLAFGFAPDFPFAQVIAGVTLAGLVLTGRWRRPPVTLETLLLTAFVLLTVITTLFAINQEGAWAELTRFLKIQLMTLLTLMLIRTSAELRTLLWVMVVSLGFYGIRGGIFTLLTGGNYRVWGPDGTFIGGNNEIGLALVMTIPLMRYLQITTHRPWVKVGLSAAIVLSAVATLGTQSRGAMLGIAVMTVFLIWKSRYRFGLAMLLLFAIPVSLAVMPQAWFDRMSSIRNYREDPSAIGRLNAWAFAWNLSMERPLIGGGFNCFTPEMFVVFAPDPTDVHDAHSIYFEVLGEHGFIGLFLFLAIGIVVWRRCNTIQRRNRGSPTLGELEHLGRMIQVCLVAYAVSGAFLGLAYFDLHYSLLAVVLVAKTLTDGDLHAQESEKETVAPALLRRLSTRGLKQV